MVTGPKKNTRQGERKLILGLVGSLRRLGNCVVMVKEISTHIEAGHDLRLIRMPSLNIRPCKACYACVTGMPCPQRDDMDFLLDRIVEADAVIIASPVYFLGAHSIFKQVLDRGFLFYRVLRETYGKPCILLNLYAIDDRVGVSSQTLMSFAAWLGLTIKANVDLMAALPGEIVLQQESVSTAKALAQQLFSPENVSSPHACPFCGCTIVRMKEARFLCTLCHGSFEIDEAGSAKPLKDGGIFGSPEHMLLHKAWLGSMKGKFMERRKEILKTTIHYKNIGEWIEPEKE
jgi:hypothetical protein